MILIFKVVFAYLFDDIKMIFYIVARAKNPTKDLAPQFACS